MALGKDKYANFVQKHSLTPPELHNRSPPGGKGKGGKGSGGSGKGGSKKGGGGGRASGGGARSSPRTPGAWIKA